MVAPAPPEFARYVAPARARPELWRLGVGIVVVLAVYMGWAFAVFAAYGALFGTPDLEAKTPGGVYLFLATFIGMALGPVVAVRLLHGRGAGTLFGRGAVVLRDFVRAALVVGVVFAVAIGGWLLVYSPVPNLEPGLWLALLPLGLLGLLIQTGAEELVFRGYLQQQLAARFATPLAWAVLPSLLFGLAHFDAESFGAMAWLFVAATGLFGLLAADLTARTGSLGAAWGFHFANNVVAILLISLAGPLSGAALFVTPYGPQAAALPWLIAVDMATVAAAWLILRRILAR